MTITTEPIPGLTIDELNHLTSSIGTDTITWSDPNYVANPFGTYSSPTTFGPNVSGVNTVLAELVTPIPQTPPVHSSPQVPTLQWWSTKVAV